MTPPCKNCITLARCKQRSKDLLDTSILSCPLVREFMVMKEYHHGKTFGQFRSERIMEIKKVMGFKN